MDFFNNVGGGELLVLALLALLLFGPEDLVKMMRTLRDYTAQARRAWTRLTAELEHDVFSDDVKEVLQETRASVDEVQQGWQDIAQPRAADLPAPESEAAPPPVYGP